MWAMTGAAWAGLITGVVIIAGAPSLALAASCKSDGGLHFLGTTAGDDRSVWLSATTAGDFALDAAKGDQTVDTWSRERRGLHVSLSPVVSKGSGGTHKLYETGDGKPCLIDTQNQKNGFNFPDFSRPPQGVVPPIGNLFPDFGSHFPSGVTPPIGTLPPSGLMPIRPGGPGSVRPPIGTRPPSGSPTRPGGVTPPIATLPPTGLSPTRPGGPGTVSPPIGTLPPGGSPGRPGGVTPPIGTLPPVGATPGLPGVTPPGSGGGTGGGSAGTGGGGGTVYGATSGAAFASRYDGLQTIDARCIDPRQRAQLGDQEPVICPEEPFATDGSVPLTPGRDLGDETPWNTWVDTTVLVIDDDRFENDTSTTTGTVTFGLDRAITDNLVAGASLSLQSGESDGFDGTMHATESGFTIGPYIALRLSEHWAIDGSVTYGRTENDLRLAVLDGDYISEQVAANVNLHGQYDLGFANIRPKGSLFYGRTFGDAYEMKGDVLGRTVTVAFPESRFDYGAVEASAEINRVFFTENGLPVMPWAELGARYDFERPNDGQVLTGDLTLEDTTPWAVSLRSGLRMLVSETTLVEASAGYLSFGQKDLDVWEGRFYISFGF